MADLGFVGLGVMGSQMVSRLLDQGNAVTGYNRTRSKAQWPIDQGMRWADSPRDVATAADTIFALTAARGMGWEKRDYAVIFDVLARMSGVEQ
jgi:3-hydroxyisobutyrate dehydrogenase-like beta-hydroxyacid dehydrogenase